MRYLLLLSFLSVSLYGIGERFYARLLLGPDLVTAAERVCTESRSTPESAQAYEQLYTKLLELPDPFYVRILEYGYKLFGASREARTATLWRETGTWVHAVLWSPIYNPVNGVMQIWPTALVQEFLLEKMSKDNLATFNELMEKLQRLDQDLDKKLQIKRAWWPTHNYAEFKDGHIELEVLIRHALATLVELRLLINRLDPVFVTVSLQHLTATIVQAIKELEKRYYLVERIDISPIKRRYGDMQVGALTTLIKRCTPPLIPLSARR